MWRLGGEKSDYKAEEYIDVDVVLSGIKMNGRTNNTVEVWVSTQVLRPLNLHIYSSLVLPTVDLVSPSQTIHFPHLCRHTA